jgi:hypothetical protein
MDEDVSYLPYELFFFFARKEISQYRYCCSDWTDQPQPNIKLRRLNKLGSWRSKELPGGKMS